MIIFIFIFFIGYFYILTQTSPGQFKSYFNGVSIKNNKLWNKVKILDNEDKKLYKELRSFHNYNKFTVEKTKDYYINENRAEILFEKMKQLKKEKKKLYDQIY